METGSLQSSSQIQDVSAFLKNTSQGISNTRKISVESSDLSSPELSDGDKAFSNGVDRAVISKDALDALKKV